MTPQLRTRLAVAAVGGACLAPVVAATPAHAQGDPISGTGSHYAVSNVLGGAPSAQMDAGAATDQVYVGDWDGDGVDTLMVRRGNWFSVNNALTSGMGTYAFAYGEVGDTIIAGDWDGDGRDTLAVRRGNVFFVRNSTTTGVADVVFTYGDYGDTVMVGDWDGDGRDTFIVRRQNVYHVRNTLTSGYADYAYTYGNEDDDEALAGDWNGDGVDTLGVRRGNTYYLRNSASTGYADSTFRYGASTDRAFSGDFDADGRDTLGLRQQTATSTPTTTTPVAPPAVTTTTAGRNIAAEDYILTKMNAARVAAGLKPMVRDTRYDAVSLAWSQQMGATGSFYHNPSFRSQLPQGFTLASENIAWESWSVSEAGRYLFDLWWNSPPHYANMMSPNFTKVGIGVFCNATTCWGTQNFSN